MSSDDIISKVVQTGDVSLIKKKLRNDKEFTHKLAMKAIRTEKIDILNGILKECFELPWEGMDPSKLFKYPKSFIWLWDHGYRGNQVGSDFQSEYYYNFTSAHPDVINFILDKGFLNEDVIRDSLLDLDEINIDLLKTLKEKTEIDLSFIYGIAIDNGKHDLLEVYHSIGIPLEESNPKRKYENIGDCAVIKNDIYALEWLDKHGFVFDSISLEKAKDSEIKEWLAKHI